MSKSSSLRGSERASERANLVLGLVLEEFLGMEP
jgi:hypothetical protein